MIVGSNKKFSSRNYRSRRIMIDFVLFLIIMILASGCIQGPDTNNNSIDHTTEIPPAPKQIYLKEGQNDHFAYWGHNITIDYVMSSPTQTIKITVDGSEKEITKEISDNPRGVYWNEKNLIFSLKPVMWEKRDGNMVPIYEKSWNTTELYFEISKTV